MKKIKPYTAEEIRKQLIESMWGTLEYCLNDERMKTPQHKLEVFMHSILAGLDGAGSLPMFLLCPNPHPDDKKYCIENGERYYPENDESKLNACLGNLHELMYKYKPKSIPDRE